MSRTVFSNGMHSDAWQAESEIELLTAESHSDVFRRNPKVRVFLARITPSLAELMLDTNIRNRNVSDRHVSVLAQTLESRDMRLNGESIIFSSEGKLMDGQHRLLACVKSKTSFDSVVVFGISPKAFDTIDGGKPRSTADVLALSGRTNTNRLSAALQALVAFVDNGGFFGGSCTNSHIKKVTPPMAARLLAAHPGIVDSVNAMAHNRLMKGQHGCILHYVFSMVDKGLAEEFADVLANGSSDTSRPFCVLRETLIRTPLTTASRALCAAKAVLAFNAELSGTRPKLLRVGVDWPRVSGLDFERLAESVK